ncbi:hypothetical protein DSO57_1032744 [Entomophthora muscae]|uniref:Uncharacterized protein n=1 Tax=Entomophthora muscae TaxID=34485 RepID=A0ACC2T0H6_9FUNG|nr:hypothetical protein DSO57_1032744 [Entomophthora muscae]
MGQAHEADYFCFPLEHTLFYLHKNFGHAVEKLAVADATAVKKTKIYFAYFGLAWSTDKTGVPEAMKLTFVKTKHEKKISIVYNKLCELLEPLPSKDFILFVMNTAIHHVLILPLVGHFKDKSLAFAFASQKNLMTESESSIVLFLDPAQLTCPTNAGGK